VGAAVAAVPLTYFGIVPRHVEEIIAEYPAKTFVPEEPLILISVGQSFSDEDRTVFEAVRSRWRTDVTKVRKFRLVFAHRRGLVVGAFRPI
jgi:hypothetical protein